MSNFSLPLYRQISATPVISTSIYANNDQLGSLMVFPGLLGSPGAGQVVITNILDKAAQSSALTLFLFSSEPTIASSDNAALNISDAEMEKCIAAVPFTNAYATTSANSINTTPVATLVVVPTYVSSSDPSGTIWGILKSGGTPTYATTSDLVVTLGVVRYQNALKI